MGNQGLLTEFCVIKTMQ